MDSRYAALSIEATTSPLERLPSAYLGTNIVFTNSGVLSPYESSYEAVKGSERTTLSAGDREKIAHNNAERLLRIG